MAEESLRLLAFLDSVTRDIVSCMSRSSLQRPSHKRKVNHKRYLMRQARRCHTATQQLHRGGAPSSARNTHLASVWPANEDFSCQDEEAFSQLQTLPVQPLSPKAFSEASLECVGSPLECGEQTTTGASANGFQCQYQNQYDAGFANCQWPNMSWYYEDEMSFDVPPKATQLMAPRNNGLYQ